MLNEPVRLSRTGSICFLENGAEAGLGAKRTGFSIHAPRNCRGITHAG